MALKEDAMDTFFLSARTRQSRKVGAIVGADGSCCSPKIRSGHIYPPTRTTRFSSDYRACRCRFIWPSSTTAAQEQGMAHLWIDVIPVIVGQKELQHLSSATIDQNEKAKLYLSSSRRITG